MTHDKRAAMKEYSEIRKWHNPQQPAIIKPNQSKGAALYGNFQYQTQSTNVFIVLPLSLSIADKLKAISLNL